MLRLLTAALVVLMLSISLGAKAAAIDNTSARVRYSNPVFKRDFPDPMVLRINAHDYWAYGTTPGWTIGYFPILHSTDFVHWRFAGDAFASPPAWAAQDLWAPDVIRHAGRYYMYYVGLGRDNRHCIGVATASRPGGPFRNRNVVACHDATGTGLIDPDLFVDSDGRAYLYVSVDGPHRITVFSMKPNLLHPADTGKPLFGVTQKWETASTGAGTVEGPFTIKRRNVYYLFYSGNQLDHAYAMGVAVSHSPLGPFRKDGHNPVLKGDRHVVGPGGGSVVEGPDGRIWMVYHAWQGQEGYQFGGVRNMRIDPIAWHGSYPIVDVHPK